MEEMIMKIVLISISMVVLLTAVAASYLLPSAHDRTHIASALQ
jgi:hypothetical protein